MAHRHKRETAASRAARAVLVAGPFALLATGAAAVMAASAPLTGPVDTGPLDDTASRAGLAHPAAPVTAPGREVDDVSRSSSRTAARSRRSLEQLQHAYHRQAAHQAAVAAREATREAIRGAHVRLWTTAALNLWTGSGAGARDVGLVDEGTRVLVTGRRSGDRAELVVEGEARWVTAAYLSPDRPPAPADHPAAGSPATSTPGPSHPSSSSPAPSAPPSTPAAQPATGALSTAPCPDDTVERGLTPSAVAVHRAVCHAFPEIRTYLGYDAHGEHASGKAIDIMTTDKALGDRIAAFLQAHAAELDLYDIIWWDRIWTPVRASEGWRDYGDHGSPTANHMDHVHVCTN